jgi:oxygen-independent coproporphyrinogen-3 oxidase
MHEELSARQLEQIATALGFSPDFAYAPPHVFPMSVPRFSPAAGAERELPFARPLGVYVHVPFCNYGCTFCFYAKKVGAGVESMSRYLAALRRELETIPSGTQLGQLYVGGGTPTALPPDLLDEVLGAVLERMRQTPGIVHTVECSPESLTAGHVAVLRERGIGRVSVGVQSLNAAVLERVGRAHSAAQALSACDLLAANDRLVNVDLIYGLPGQTEESLRDDLTAFASRGVDSFTLYNLRVNEKTPVARILDDRERLTLARLVRWRAFAKRATDELGFVQTRWHGFRRRDLPPWKAAFVDLTSTGDQFGAGNSARSRFDGAIYRNHPSLEVYVERLETGGSPVEEVFRMDEGERKLRFVTLTLGDGASLDLAEYERSFGRSFLEDYSEPVRRLADLGLLGQSPQEVFLTHAGKLVYDLATLAFYPATMQRWLGERRAQTAARHPGAFAAST